MRAVLAIAFLFLSSLAQAEGFDGNYLIMLAFAHDRAIEGRGSLEDAVNAGKLAGYVAAVADRAIFMKVVCYSSSVTYEQIIAVTKKSIRNDPASWNLPGFLVIQTALVDAFPCKKK